MLLRQLGVKKWASDGASANYSFWTTTSGGPTDETDGVIEAVSLRSTNSGSRANDDTIAITWSRATAAQVSIATSGARTESVIDWTIGDSEADTDNGTTINRLILYLTEVTDGVISSGNATIINTSGAVTNFGEITTTLNYTSNTDTSTVNAKSIFPTDGRGDVVNNEADYFYNRS